MAPSKQKAEKADVPADKLAALDYYTHNQEYVGRCVIDLSLSGRPPAPSEGPGPQHKKQKHLLKQPFR